MYLFLAFLLVPLIEIGLFIQVGGAIGLWPTLGIVIATAILGTWMVRQQGARVIGQLREALNALGDPSEPLAHGAMILFSGALLLTPGFFTDAVGFALLLPPVRAAVFRWARSRIKVQGFGPTQSGPSQGPGGRPARQPDAVIDGEYSDVTPNEPGSGTPSGWTRH